MTPLHRPADDRGEWRPQRWSGMVQRWSAMDLVDLRDVASLKKRTLGM